MKPRWTPAEDELIRRAADAGDSYRDAATELAGRSRSAVARRAARLGIPFGDDLADMRRKMRVAWRRRSIAAAAEAVGHG